MKKTLASVVAIAMSLAATVSAKSTALLFNRYQFQPAEYTCMMNYPKVLLTVPLVYKGTVATQIENLEFNDKQNEQTDVWKRCDGGFILTINAQNVITSCKPEDTTKEYYLCYKVDQSKLSTPIFMTICQPCIDCFPCTTLPLLASDVPTPFNASPAAEGDYADIMCNAMPGNITKWNIYYVLENLVYNGIANEKQLEIDKFNLLDQDYASAFFTGRKGAAPGIIYIDGYKLFLTGKKSDYSFKYTEAFINANGMWNYDEDAAKFVTGTAYVKSIAAMTGTALVSGQRDAFVAPTDKDGIPIGIQWDGGQEPLTQNIIANFKLTRDAALTKRAIEDTFRVTFAKKGKNWEDCNIAEDASYCEEYFTVEKGDKFDEYLEGQYGGPKSSYAKKGYVYNMYVKDETYEVLEKDSSGEYAPVEKTVADSKLSEE